MEMLGRVTAKEGQLGYRAAISTLDFDPSVAESLTEFLFERYTAFTCQGRRCRLFRVWHGPWPQAPIEIEVTSDDGLHRPLVEQRRTPGRELFPWCERLDGPSPSDHRLNLASEFTELRPSRIEARDLVASVTQLHLKLRVIGCMR